MFWLNSRSALVTATSHSRGWHPLSRSYGANLPSSLTSVKPDTPRPSQPGAPVSVLGTDTTADTARVFTGTRHQSNPPEGEPFGVSRGSLHYGSPPAYRLRRGDGRAQPSPMRPHAARGRHGAGILTCFPFAHPRLRGDLGPTNPRLTIIVEETWPFRRCGFSPHYAVTHAKILIRTRSIGSQNPTSTHARPLPTHLPKEWRGIGGRLSPVHFPGPRSRPVICYELFKGLLLLSTPSSCFRPRTPFDF